MEDALKDLKIVELSHVLAAPFCGYQFALLGAQVIKVELPASPDCARGRGPLPSQNARGVGLTYQVRGGNKQSLALDFRTDRGRAALLKLVETADVFLENYTTGVLEGSGLGYQALRRCNPEIIYCSMTGYGDEGPKSAKGAYDNTIQAAAGVVGQCGGAKPGLSFVDYAAGYSAAFAISAALLQRERTGAGCHISASMLEVAMSLMAPEVAARQAAPAVSKHREAGLLAYETSNGQLMLGAFTPSQYRRLGTCLTAEGHDVPALAAMRDWTDVWENADAIRTALQKVFVLRSAAEWQAALESVDVPAECIVTLDEAILAPQLAERGYFIPSPADPAVTLPLAGYRMSRGGPMLHTAPPYLGQDSRVVLAAAGLEATEVEALIETGVVQ